MITISFENREKKSLWEWIYLSIKEQIENQMMSPNEKLPSKRTLASHLGVSIITVQNAYERLIDEGWIYSIEKKGFFVSDYRSNKIIDGAIKSEIFKIKKYERLLDQAQEEKKSLQSENQIIDLTSNSVNEKNFPFSLWSKICRKILSQQSSALLERTSVFGTVELRKSLAQYLSDFRGLVVDWRQIVVGAGTESLYTMLSQFLGREKILAVENPGYIKVSKIFELNGIKTVAVKTDKEGMSLDELLKTKSSVIHISPNHHFPTGTVMSIKRRLELLDWCEKKSDRFIIEDDYDSEFRFNGKPLPLLQSSDNFGRVIYVNTFSKVLSPSFRISYMVLPKQLLQEFTDKLGIYSCPVPALDQLILSEFIKGGHLEKHISRTKNFYRNIRNTLIQGLEKSELSKKSKILEENSGLHFLFKIKSEKSPDEIKKELLSYNIKIAFLDDFYLDKDEISNQSGETTFIINYSALKKEDIPNLLLAFEKTFPI